MFFEWINEQLVVLNLAKAVSCFFIDSMSVQFDNLRTASVPFTDDAVLSVVPDHDRVPGEFLHTWLACPLPASFKLTPVQTVC